MSHDDRVVVDSRPNMVTNSEPDPASRSRAPITLSAVLVAKNAAATIAKAIRAVRFCDEIVVIVDQESTDETEAIARRYADQVDLRPWMGYGPTKRAAIDLARGRWILIIDSDEEVSPELAVAISEAIRNGKDADIAAYALRRRTRYLGRWMKHGDWGRDRVVRLFDRTRAELSDDPVHESVHAPGDTPALHGLLLHEGDQTLPSYLARLDRYTTLAAQSLFDKGRRSSWLSITVRPAFKFIQAYILRMGFLDGWQGLVLAFYSSVYVFTKYAKLMQLERDHITSSK
ncbi:MAG: glycosyltransferase [candidate division Zixibacteria bacterium]|nr:glycosyltransferase [candidate division Zixibacteria bacterium]